MKNLYISNLIIFTHILFISCTSTENIPRSGPKPVLKISMINQDSVLSKSKDDLLNKADRHLEKDFKTIVDKDATPPSGDKHDYMSRAIYYWPDPADANKKWIYKDGVVNEESLKETDHYTFFEAMGAIRDLSLSYYLTDDEKYAVKAFQLINQWFVNEQTRMNPNFNFAQAIPGKNDGTHWGIISARAIVWVIYGLEFLNESPSLDADINNEFKIWCGEFMSWLRYGDFGIKESKRKTNHGTFYDLQLAELANFTGEERNL